jgi:hypothetical protein
MLLLAAWRAASCMLHDGRRISCVSCCSQRCMLRVACCKPHVCLRRSCASSTSRGSAAASRARFGPAADAQPATPAIYRRSPVPAPARNLRRHFADICAGFAHVCAGTRAHLRRDSPASAPGFARICAGTRPHLRRDSPASAPGFAHVCAGTRPHLRRDSPASVPGLAHVCAGTRPQGAAFVTAACWARSLVLPPCACGTAAPRNRDGRGVRAKQGRACVRA